MEMIWKDVVGYEGLYQVSNIGIVKGVDRFVNAKGGKKRLAKGKIIKPCIDKDGYLTVTLHKEGIKFPYHIHRLVAMAFLENVECLPVVHHINGNNQDNRVENLMWVSVEYNNSENIARKRKSEGAFRRNDNKVKIRQYSIDGELIKDYNSAREIERELGFDCSSIIRVCKGKQNTSYGYKWVYIN